MHVELATLWLPILLSAVIVFIASALIWTALPIHKSDWRKLGDEAGAIDALRKQGVSPGQYMFPYCKGSKDFQDPEVVQKFIDGPVGYVVIREPGKPSMGTPMILSFIYYVIVSAFVAYLTGHTLMAGSNYLEVFRVAGTAAVLAYSGALFPSAIWFGRPWSAVWKEVIDGVVYGLLTAGVFGWLWPR